MSRQVSAKLDLGCRGPNVQVDRSGSSGAGEVMKGAGTILCNTSIQQDRAYFEVTVVTAGAFRVGCGQRAKLKGQDFAGGALDKQLGESSDGTWGHELMDLQAGDTVGCTYDQLIGPTPELNFFVNGTRIDGATLAKKTRGSVYPAISVASQAAVRVNFGVGSSGGK